MRSLIRVAIVPLCALSLLVSSIAVAHDGHNDEWFKTLRSVAGSYCCDGSDAIFIDDPEWEIQGDSYRVRLKGEWIDVPPAAVVRDSNRVGYAVVWPWNEGLSGNTKIRCFLPGTTS